MGVSIYPGRASWSYSGFANFRRALAGEEGINLAEMTGFGGTREWETSSGQHITPLAPLLNHSDCDGYLHGYECEEVIPRLETILSKWARDADPETQYNVQHGLALLAGMKHSVEHGCAVVFS